MITGPPASTTRSTHASTSCSLLVVTQPSDPHGGQPPDLHASTSCSLLVVTQPSDPHGKREKVREGIKRGKIHLDKEEGLTRGGVFWRRILIPSW
jgi:hypothetical protein